MREKIEVLHKKALQMISFLDPHEASSALFKEWKILKIKDMVDIQICLLVHSFLKEKLSKLFENFFQKCSDIQIYPTRFSSSEFYTCHLLKV